MTFNPKHKFNNKKVETADGVFDSKGEWQRWLFLKEAERNGEISNLRRQVKYTLIPTQYRTEIVHLKTKDKEVKRVAEREVTYTADFVYELNEKLVLQRHRDEILGIEFVCQPLSDFVEDDETLLELIKKGEHGVFDFFIEQTKKDAKRFKFSKSLTNNVVRGVLQDIDENAIRKFNSFRIVVEDYKGFPNDRWPLKKAMMLYFHGVSIREVKKPGEPI